MMIELLCIHAVREELYLFIRILRRIGEGNSTVKTMTFAQLHENVRSYRAALQHVGVTVGDRVVGNRILRFSSESFS